MKAEVCTWFKITEVYFCLFKWLYCTLNNLEFGKLVSKIFVYLFPDINIHIQYAYFHNPITLHYQTRIHTLWNRKTKNNKIIFLFPFLKHHYVGNSYYFPKVYYFSLKDNNSRIQIACLHFLYRVCFAPFSGAGAFLIKLDLESESLEYIDNPVNCRRWPVRSNWRNESILM